MNWWMPKIISEFIGTAFLLAMIIGSGIMGTDLAPNQTAFILLVNALATAAGLFVLISVFSPISGAHFNPIVTAIMVLKGELELKMGALYVMAQAAGAFTGVVLSHIMFSLSPIQLSTTIRSSLGISISESIATFGLIITILGLKCHNPKAIPAGVALYIGSAYWFTSSTSFANPIVTLARGLTDSFAGIAPESIPVFILMQTIGAVFAYWIGGLIFESKEF